MTDKTFEGLRGLREDPNALFHQLLDEISKDPTVGEIATKALHARETKMDVTNDDLGDALREAGFTSMKMLFVLAEGSQALIQLGLSLEEIEIVDRWFEGHMEGSVGE